MKNLNAASLAAVALVSAVLPARATLIDLLVNPAASSVATDSALSVDASGTFIGNYDPVSNPGGTLTRPGLFGGSGNIPIPFTADGTAGGQHSAQPTGGFTVDLDLPGSTIELSALSAQLLGGTTASLPVTFALTFGTFRTFQPDSVFFGVSGFPIELGEATVSQFDVLQTAPVSAVIVPAGVDAFTFSVVIPADVTIAGEFNGSPFGPTTAPTLLAMEGAGSISGSTLTITLSFNIDQQETIKGPIPGAENIPFDLPTVLPPGETAHLLVSFQIDGGSTDVSATVDLSADGLIPPPACTGDLDGDLDVDSTDLNILLSDFGCLSACPGDADGDDDTDSTDLNIILSVFGSTCD